MKWQKAPINLNSNFKYYLFVLVFCLNLINAKAGTALKTLPFLTEKEYNECFPLRNPYYSYTAFAQAYAELAEIKIKIERRGGWIYKIIRIDKKSGKSQVIRQDKDWDENWAKEKTYQAIEIDYADFCQSKKELCAFLAQIAHETRDGTDNKFNDGLMLLHEISTQNSYVSPSQIYPAIADKKYYGRGPLQLSYNGNYGFASECIFGDKNILLNNPDLILNDATVAFKTAIYFWMTPQSLKPSVHDVVSGIWKPTDDDVVKGYKPGFGMSINIINGAVECGKGQSSLATLNRINYYKYFLAKFKVSDPDCACSCALMTPFED